MLVYFLFYNFMIDYEFFLSIEYLWVINYSTLYYSYI